MSKRTIKRFPVAHHKTTSLPKQLFHTQSRVLNAFYMQRLTLTIINVYFSVFKATQQYEKIKKNQTNPPPISP